MLFTSVPPITRLELPFTPQLSKSLRTDLWTNGVVVAGRCVVVGSEPAEMMTASLSSVFRSPEAVAGALYNVYIEKNHWT